MLDHGVKFAVRHATPAGQAEAAVKKTSELPSRTRHPSECRLHMYRLPKPSRLDVVTLETLSDPFGVSKSDVGIHCDACQPEVWLAIRSDRHESITGRRRVRHGISR